MKEKRLGGLALGVVNRIVIPKFMKGIVKSTALCRCLLIVKSATAIWAFCYKTKNIVRLLIDTQNFSVGVSVSVHIWTLLKRWSQCRITVGHQNLWVGISVRLHASNLWNHKILVSVTDCLTPKFWCDASVSASIFGTTKCWCQCRITGHQAFVSEAVTASIFCHHKTSVSVSHYLEPKLWYQRPYLDTTKHKTLVSVSDYLTPKLWCRNQCQGPFLDTTKGWFQCWITGHQNFGIRCPFRVKIHRKFSNFLSFWLIPNTMTNVIICIWPLTLPVGQTRHTTATDLKISGITYDLKSVRNFTGHWRTFSYIKFP